MDYVQHAFSIIVNRSIQRVFEYLENQTQRDAVANRIVERWLKQELYNESRNASSSTQTVRLWSFNRTSLWKKREVIHCRASM